MNVEYETCDTCKKEKHIAMFLKKSSPITCKACYAKKYRQQESQKEREKKYSKLPNVLAKKAERERARRKNPEVIAKLKEYNNRPDVIERRKSRYKIYQSTRCQDIDFKEKKRAYMKEYYMRPEVNNARKSYEKLYNKDPDVQERKLLYAKKYRENPENKKRREEWMKGYFTEADNLEKRKKWAKTHYSKPEVKEKKREYAKKPEVKEKKREYAKRPEAKERMTRINRRDIENAADRYVKYLIRQRSGRVLGSEDISKSLIETQKQSLILKRLLKQKKQQNEQLDSTNV